MSLPLQPPLALYVHFPWCVRKCPYCDFNSHQLRGDLPELRYVEILLNDLDRDLAQIGEVQFVSVFLGGGTPSLFSATAIDDLLSGLAQRGLLSAQTEITLEVNPGTLDANRFRGFRDAGVNRISIGVQSFNDVHLQRLGRIHDAKTALRAIERAQAAGFDNLNIDLMFGLPEQTVEEGLADLEMGVSLEPAHLSYYQLTIEPNTAFYKTPPSLPSEDCVFDLFDASSSRLRAAGYERYEVSAWAKESNRCQHNLNYWQFADYLGVGAGAHSKITNLAESRITRAVKHKHPGAYLAADNDGNYTMSSRVVSCEERVFEFMLNALRLKGGVSWALFEERTGVRREAISDLIAKATGRGLLASNLLCPTELGERFLDDLVSIFIPDGGADVG